MKAYADGCMLALSYCRQGSQRATTAVNKQLRAAEEWGRAWQVNFVTKKHTPW